MAQITAALVKTLRERTGAGMMDCKKALSACEGDLDKAVDFLREKGLSQAAKKASRVAAEGAVAAYVSEDAKVGVIVLGQQRELPVTVQYGASIRAIDFSRKVTDDFGGVTKAISHIDCVTLVPEVYLDDVLVAKDGKLVR